MTIQYEIDGRTAAEITRSVEDAVRQGLLVPGMQLPSVRALAAELSVSPGTVATAYRQLRDRGLVDSRGRNGTVVRGQSLPTSRAAPYEVGSGIVDLASGQADPALLPDLSSFRSSVLTGPAAAPESLFEPGLLAVAAQRLSADGVPTDSLTLASGGLDAMHRLLVAHLRAGDSVAVEDPGWPNLFDLIAALGLRALPMTIDDHGPQPGSLRSALEAGARAVVVTSRAQNPTGASISSARATELRGVLADHPLVLVLEDDHAAEIAGTELHTVGAATESWAFVRSTSKPYGPDLRFAVISGDAATIARIEGRMLAGSGWVSTILQRLVLNLWTSRETEHLIDRACRTYAIRRTRLISELGRRGIAAEGGSGINVWIPVRDETAAVAGLVQSGWAVAPGARFRQRTPPGIRITLSGLDEQDITQLAVDIARVVGRSTRSTPRST